MDDVMLHTFQPYLVVSGRSMDENERVCATGPRLRLKRFRLERGLSLGALDQ